MFSSSLLIAHIYLCSGMREYRLLISETANKFEFLDLAVAWEALLGFDSLIFILTLLKTYRARPRHNFMLQKRINIVSLVLRDGKSIMDPYMTYNSFWAALIHRCYLLCVSGLQRPENINLTLTRLVEVSWF
jgi:hypothetical protein